MSAPGWARTRSQRLAWLYQENERLEEALKRERLLREQAEKEIVRLRALTAGDEPRPRRGRHVPTD